MTHDPRPIAFQGDLGANSHIAIAEKYGADAGVLPCASFEDAFAAVKTGEARLAMIPIENTLAGRVADVHHFLPESGLRIVGEHFLPIHFHLMALPGVNERRIRSIHSHVHALGQCRRLLDRRVVRRDKASGQFRKAPRWAKVVEGDTAGAARLVAESGDRTMAALAPRMAAELYGLAILRENVEDAAHNVTRFVVLSPAYAPERALWARANNGPVVTTFVFRVRNIPAALYKALGGFATNTVNMTKLESYQLGGTFFATQFYADVEGHPEDGPLARALEELRFFSRELTILGVYAAAPDRARMAAAAV